MKAHLRILVALYYLFVTPLAVYGIVIILKITKLSNFFLFMLGAFGLLTVLILFFEGRRWIREKDQQIAQRSRDQRALSFYNQLIDVDNLKERSPFTLYLRPFSSTGHVRIPLKSFMLRRGILTEPTFGIYDTQLGKTTLFKRYVTFGDFETELAKLVEIPAPLIALGRVGEQIGAGRIESNDDGWQVKFKLLANKSRVIFLIPSTHEGTKWEIDFILSESEILRKTIFFIPPNDTILGYGVGPHLEIGASPGKIGTFNLNEDALEGLALIYSSINKIKKLEGGGLVQFSTQHRIKLCYALKIKKSLSFHPFTYGSNLHLDFAELQQVIENIIEAKK